MLATFKDFSQPVRDILRLIAKAEVWALFDHPKASTYHQERRICLLGDAAQASTPHHGAGAGMVVEDAMILSKLRTKVNSAEELEKIFSTYDTVRGIRSQRLVQSSRKVAEVFGFEAAETGDDMAAVKEYLEHAWDWIWNEDLDLQIEQTMQVIQDPEKGNARLDSN